jgi:hypothetical protein
LFVVVVGAGVVVVVVAATVVAFVVVGAFVVVLGFVVVVGGGGLFVVVVVVVEVGAVVAAVTTLVTCCGAGLVVGDSVGISTLEAFFFIDESTQHLSSLFMQATGLSSTSSHKNDANVLKHVPRQFGFLDVVVILDQRP